MTEREYQLVAKKLLERIYEEVEVQWHPFLGHGRKIYSPAIDIAIGPFATERRYGDRYTELIKETRVSIERFIEAHNENVGDDAENLASFDNFLYFNHNARCLIGIEVEKSGSKKHCIGNLVNVSALSRVGLLIAWSPDMLRTFLRQRVYLKYLASVGKNTFDITNALVLTSDQFGSILRRRR